jgi:GNAT superfamily N-acetyltransferase
MPHPRISDFEANQLEEIVKIHLDAFPNFFLSFLGARFLRPLYLSFGKDRHGISLVAKSDQRIAGFVFGSTKPAGLYLRLLQREWLRFAWATLPAFLRRPSILPRVLRAFKMPKQPLPAENCATLMSIAVEPTFQGQNIGKLLVKAFLDEARLRGSQNINLTTDAVGNDSVNHFYQSIGFKLFRKYTTPEGRIMNEFLIKL